MTDARCKVCGKKFPRHVEDCPGVRPIDQSTSAPGQSGPVPEYTEEDQKRIAAQRQRVWAVMSDAQWHTLAELSAKTGDPEASVSARLRDFRRLEHGGHTVERRRVVDGGGQWEYRLQVNDGSNTVEDDD